MPIYEYLCESCDTKFEKLVRRAEDVLESGCPKCGQKVNKTIGWIKANSHLACACGANIRLDKERFLGPLKQAEDALKSFPRNITIKL